MPKHRNRRAWGASAKSGPSDRPRPTLSLTWTLDPVTGKPVGRWVVEAAQVPAAAAA